MVVGSVAVSVACFMWAMVQRQTIKNIYSVLGRSQALDSETRIFVDKTLALMHELNLDSDKTLKLEHQIKELEKHVSGKLEDLRLEEEANKKQMLELSRQMQHKVPQSQLASHIQKCLFQLAGGEKTLGEYVFDRINNATHTIDDYKELYRFYAELWNKVNVIKKEYVKLKEYGIYEDFEMEKLPSDIQKHLRKGIRSIIDYVAQKRELGPRLEGNFVDEECSPVYRETDPVRWVTRIFKDVDSDANYGDVCDLDKRGVKLQGTSVNLTIELKDPSSLGQFSIEYPYLVNETDSAPRQMEFYSYDGNSSLLCQMEYAAKGPIVQTCLVGDHNPVKKIRLRVVNNWGNPYYTWIYKWGIHGRNNQ